MDKELIQIEKTELIETLGKLLNDFQRFKTMLKDFSKMFIDF